MIRRCRTIRVLGVAKKLNRINVIMPGTSL